MAMDKIRSSISTVKDVLSQKRLLILFVAGWTTVGIQYLNQQQKSADWTIRQKRSSPSNYASAIDSQSQIMSISRELQNVDEDETNINQETESQFCVSPEKIDWDVPVTPLYQTNTEQFLMPVLIWGPMNQVEGFRETIALAISLNRTLVIPPMYRHFTDPTDPNGIVDPEVRIDIPTVRKLISTISYKALPANLAPDSIMIARSLGMEIGSDSSQEGGSLSGSRVGRLKRFETATGFEVAKWNSENFHEQSASTLEWANPIYPADSTLEAEIRLEYETTNWTDVFGTAGDFSVLLFPYLTARFKPEQPIGRSIMKYTPRPSFLNAMADQFLTASGFEQTFVTLHYRFDKEDWERSCRRTEKTRNMKRNDKRQKICDLLATSTSDGIAEAVASYLVELYSLGQIGNSVALYIATPPQQQEMIHNVTIAAVQKVKEQLGDKVKVNAKSTMDSTGYFETAYANCEFVQENMHEVFSLFEQEICSRGKVFVYAPSSSWSGSIRRERHMSDLQHKLIDHSLLDILENYPKDEELLVLASQQLQTGEINYMLK